jgi:hypothetical protein
MEDPTKESGKEDEVVEQIKSQQSIKDDGCIKVVKEQAKQLLLKRKPL